jgi:hypothetical protein
VGRHGRRPRAASPTIGTTPPIPPACATTA